MEILSLFVFWVGVALCLPCGFLLIEVVAGVLGRGRSQSPTTGNASDAVLLIPAHDEQALLGEMLDRLASVNDHAVRTVVIADNCSDDTAAIAREAGVEVWVRSHETLRGKPFALAWAIKRLQANPPDVVVFLDADSWFERGSPSQLACLSMAEGRPVQAIYRMADAGLRGFAFRFRNEARLRGLRALGAPTQLTGSGFAVPWKLLQSYPIPVGELVEDAFWGWTFTRAGVGPLLATNVEVLSFLPNSKEGAQTQMRRWEHGILSATIRSLPSLLRSAFLPPRLSRSLHLFDVLVPPLALLGLLCLLLLIVGLFTPSYFVLIPVAMALFFLSSAVLVGWGVYGRDDVSFQKLLSSPFYAIGKIGVYASFLFRRQKVWQRTERDDD
jgi:cellulose synthase/poly-beta-1,6-N-acetylglucosamine synthase-like glycosyltransferase